MYSKEWMFGLHQKEMEGKKTKEMCNYKPALFVFGLRVTAKQYKYNMMKWKPKQM